VVEANAVAPEEELPKEATGVAEYVTTRAAVVASLRFKDRLGGLGLVDVDMMIDFMNLWLLWTLLLVLASKEVKRSPVKLFVCGMRTQPPN